VLGRSAAASKEEVKAMTDAGTQYSTGATLTVMHFPECIKTKAQWVSHSHYPDAE
jgi:hypothetical protein